MARIVFTKTHPRFGDFTDAVELPDDATPEQIEAAQQARFDKWVGFLENPPPVDEPVDPPAE